MVWNEIDALYGLIGGIFIGLACAMLILFNGRVAGISSILGGLLNGEKNEMPWRLSFIAGLLLAVVLYQQVIPLPTSIPDASLSVAIISGLLVGLGTRMGGGCTSGHGVCGLARLSKRSFVATLVFILSGMLTVYWVYHV